MPTGDVRRSPEMMATPGADRTRTYSFNLTPGAATTGRGKAKRAGSSERFNPASLPPEPAMPAEQGENPDRYARSMRLLWLAASMKNFDVVIAVLPTDGENIALLRLIHDMLPLLLAVRKHGGAPPQVLVQLDDPAMLTGLQLHPKPLVIPKLIVLPSLICEILHPTAHWTGVLGMQAEEDARNSSSGDLLADLARARFTPSRSPNLRPLSVDLPAWAHSPGPGSGGSPGRRRSPGSQWFESVPEEAGGTSRPFMKETASSAVPQWSHRRSSGADSM